jgi:GH18 family chitinase
MTMMRLRWALLVAAMFMNLQEAAASSLWSAAYYAAWMQGYLPPSSIDFKAITDVIHFAVIPNEDGTLDSETNEMTAERSSDLVLKAHAAGVPAVVSVGGADSAAGFRGATSASRRSTFVSNIVAFVKSRGYDGVDIDWEPLEASDASQYTALVEELSSVLDPISPRPLLTVAVATQPDLIASLQGRFDQIHVMTYSLSGPWRGRVTWFDAPLYDGGYRFPNTNALAPSADRMLNRFLAAGVETTKLGIGIDFYGTVWRGGSGTSTGGVTAPRQSWNRAPVAYEIPYYSIMDNYSQLPSEYHWDEATQAAYFSVASPSAATDKFISYDDATACRKKVEYAKEKGLGGVVIWELGGGYRANQPSGQQDPLLQAVNQALRRDGAPSDPIVSATPTALPTPTPRPQATVGIPRTSSLDDVTLVANQPSVTQMSTSSSVSTTLATPARPACNVPALPLTGTRIVKVSTESALQTAMRSLLPGDTVLISNGTYHLSRTLYINAKSNVTIRGASGCDGVVLIGKGMNLGGTTVPNGVWSNSLNTTVAHLTIRDTYDNTVIFNAGAQAPHVYSVKLLNSGSQFVKANPTNAANGIGVNNGILEYSWMEYTNGTPANHGSGAGYTNGISAHSADNWMIRGNLFKNFHTPDSATYRWNPAVLMWNRSSNTITEKNTFINVDRAIAYGLIQRTAPAHDHIGGVIRNNFVYLTPTLMSANRKLNSDATIIVDDSPGTKVYHNTILSNGNINYAIEFRFRTTVSGEGRNNLTDLPIHVRDGASAVFTGNYGLARPFLFVNPAAADLHLLSTATVAINKAPALTGVATDLDGQARPQGAGYDIGADEFKLTP